ncbi:MAG: histidinol dehydrogenase [Alphaproteobacteria bacterium]|nr:histidinol dehydrogenase [Alphaproteobacteria bacterium]
METIVWNGATAAQKKKALERPALPHDENVFQTVEAIVGEVKAKGDTALRTFNARFGGGERKNLRVAKNEMDAALLALPSELRASLRRAKRNIERFHKAQRPEAVLCETEPGVRCGLLWRPIERVGLYIPAGTAPLFSAVLMEAVPAKIAGCATIVLCTPPRRDGSVDPGILAAARLCGIKDVFAVGGAQAIAAMAYGTRTVPKVDKIFGPGNMYVTAAKQLVSQDPSGAVLDMPAGPSEVLVIADAEANADWVAADLLAQAEHDAASQAILLTSAKTLAKKVQEALAQQLEALPRKAIAEKSLKQGRIILVRNIPEAVEVSNLYAPEHLILHTKNAARLLPTIRHAGSVFVGSTTPETAGDYASGTNHVLPTYGYARTYGGLSVYSFMKSMTVQTLTSDGLKALGPTLVRMARAETLDAHANAVTVRLGGCL